MSKNKKKHAGGIKIMLSTTIMTMRMMTMIMMTMIATIMMMMMMMIPEFPL